ncbi:uncharacterized protein LOC100175479 [Ciona intestinalis]
MKMKRFFTSKGKKKKSNSDAILDEKILEISDADNSPACNDSYTSNQEQSKNGTKRIATKKVSKPRSPSVGEIFIDPAELENGHSLISANQSNVVLRRSSRDALGNGKHSHRQSQDRIPGSESSSRTASSASSQSFTGGRRWSARRPWSLVESFRGQTLSEFAESQPRSYTPEAPNHLNTSEPAATFTRGLTLEEIQPTAKGGRTRTLTLDNFFRRFKKSTSSSSGKSPSDTDSSSGIFGSGRGSFRLKGSKGKKSKKKRKGSSSDSSTQIEHSSSASVSDSRLSRVASIPEESYIPPNSTPTVVANKYVRTQSNGSSASTDTVVSISEVPDTVKHVPFAKPTSDNVFAKEILESACSEYQDEYISSERHDHCVVTDSPQFTTVGEDISIIETSSSYVYSNAASSRSQPNINCNVTPSNTLGAPTPVKRNAETDICDESSLTSVSTTEGSVTFSNSATCLAHRTIESIQATEMNTQTLPRRRSHTTTPVQLRKPLDNQIMYASSPQLTGTPHVQRPHLLSTLHPSNFSNNNESLDRKELKKASGSVSSTDGKSPTVDSPIKRAIGYPGVVLRRHQNRRPKKHTVKQSSSSGDFMSVERRAKQVMSLNMEDLPTYGQMKHRRRSTSLFTRDGRPETFHQEGLSGVEAGRARLRAALLYQRYSSLSTSVDDVNMIKLMLGSQQSLDNLDNMDDDEFLDMYLASPDTLTVGGDAVRSQQQQEPSSKRVKTLRKSVASIANLISPGKPSRTKLQRSSSFKESPAPSFKPYRPPGSQQNTGAAGSTPSSGSTPGKRSNSGSVTKNRRSKLWCETFDHRGVEETELKRQETIFELYQGECDLVDDLRMAKQTYRDSMVTLKMLTEDEVTRIFGKLDCLLPLHENLLQHLEAERTSDGKCDAIGHVFLSWFPTLTPYDEYCANQADAKGTLDTVVNKEARVRDFLQRCLESPFSRKLDLWSYLDLPRSRLVKYPLLLKNVLKATPSDHPDAVQLEKALTMVNDVITRVDDLTGERQSRFILSKLDFLDDKQKCPELEESRALICSGQLKSSRGTKLHVFLFDLVLVLARNVTRNDKSYQVYRRPIPLSHLIIEGDEGGRMSGSFRGGILSGDKAKYAFRVRSDELGLSYTLIAADEHDRKQWVNSITEATAKFQSRRGSSAGSEPSNPGRWSSDRRAPPAPEAVPVKRSSSVKSDRGGLNSWYRNRSMTANQQSGINRDVPVKKESRRQSPLFSRRKPLSRSRLSLAVSKSIDNDENMEVSPSPPMESPNQSAMCRRSRSLTSSPITLLSAPPPRPAAGLSRSESCTTKPPTGRVHQLAQSFSNPNFQSPSKSRFGSKLQPTLSNPELHQRMVVIDTTLEEVKERLSSPTGEEETTPLVNVLTATPGSSVGNSPVVKNHQNMSHLFIDSPDHPAASNTSRNFPMDEEDSISPLYKSLPTTTTCSSSLFSSSSFSSSSSSVMPILGWTIPKPSIDSTKPDVFAEDCDVTLSSVTEEASANLDGDITPTNETLSIFSPSDVTKALCDIIDTVCSQEVKSSGVILTSDDGLQFRGNRDEVTV